MAGTRNSSSAGGYPKRVTLQDIAKVAGVHVMTVSDALNDRRSVAPATRERIKNIAREMNYIPNLAARALVTGRSGMIAVLSGPLNEAYYATMVHHLEDQLSSDGFKLLLLRTQNEVRDIINATGTTSVDGAIAIDQHDLVQQFRARPSLPCVSIGTITQTFLDHVIIDLSAGVRQALTLMIEAGRRRIAYLITAPELGQPSEVRARAYFATMREAGLPPEVINVASDDFPVVRANFQAYVEEHGCPDALLCQNDETAMCAYRVLRDSGCRVPDDTLLVGCDGQLHMEYFDPPLSTIVQPMEQACAAAWRFLKARMNEPERPLQETTLSGTLIVRASLGQQAAHSSSLFAPSYRPNSALAPVS